MCTFSGVSDFCVLQRRCTDAGATLVGTAYATRRIAADGGRCAATSSRRRSLRRRRSGCGRGVLTSSLSCAGFTYLKRTPTALLDRNAIYARHGVSHVEAMLVLASRLRRYLLVVGLSVPAEWLAIHKAGIYLNMRMSIESLVSVPSRPSSPALRPHSSGSRGLPNSRTMFH